MDCAKKLNRFEEKVSNVKDIFKDISQIKIKLLNLQLILPTMAEEMANQQTKTNTILVGILSTFIFKLTETQVKPWKTPCFLDTYRLNQNIILAIEKSILGILVQ